MNEKYKSLYAKVIVNSNLADKQYNPDYVVPPGKTLEETLVSKGMFLYDLVFLTGLTEEEIGKIIDGTLPITQNIAEKLELGVGIPARFWLAREKSYREGIVQNEY